MRFVEYEGVLYRGEAGPGFPVAEKLVGGEWRPAGASGMDAALYGSPVEESEAAEMETGGEKEKAEA